MMPYNERVQWIRKIIKKLNKKHVNLGDDDHTFKSDIHPSEFRILDTWVVTCTDCPKNNSVQITIFEKLTKRQFDFLVIPKNQSVNILKS